MYVLNVFFETAHNCMYLFKSFERIHYIIFNFLENQNFLSLHCFFLKYNSKFNNKTQKNNQRTYLIVNLTLKLRNSNAQLNVFKRQSEFFSSFFLANICP